MDVTDNMMEIDMQAPFQIHKPYESSANFADQLETKWVSMKSSPYKLLNGLGSRPNLTLRLNGEQIYMHDFILVAHCRSISSLTSVTNEWNPTFYTIDLISESKDLLTSNAMSKVVEFLYTGTMEFSFDQMAEILEVVSFFDINHAKWKIGDIMVRYCADNGADVNMNCLQMSFTFNLPKTIKNQLVKKCASLFNMLLNVPNDEHLYSANGRVIEALISCPDLQVSSPAERCLPDFLQAWFCKNPGQAKTWANILLRATCKFFQRKNIENWDNLLKLTDRFNCTYMIRHLAAVQKYRLKNRKQTVDSKSMIDIESKKTFLAECPKLGLTHKIILDDLYSYTVPSKLIDLSNVEKSMILHSKKLTKSCWDNCIHPKTGLGEVPKDNAPLELHTTIDRLSKNHLSTTQTYDKSRKVLMQLLNKKARDTLRKHLGKNWFAAEYRKAVRLLSGTKNSNCVLLNRGRSDFNTKNDFKYSPDRSRSL